MAKFIIEFDDADPEDVSKLIRVIKSTEMACVLFEITGNIKKSVEHRIDSGHIKTPGKAIDYFMEKIDEEMESKSLNINELIN